jgi:hypothetical protein
MRSVKRMSKQASVLASLNEATARKSSRPILPLDATIVLPVSGETSCKNRVPVFAFEQKLYGQLLIEPMRLDI